MNIEINLTYASRYEVEEVVKQLKAGDIVRVRLRNELGLNYAIEGELSEDSEGNLLLPSMKLLRGSEGELLVREIVYLEVLELALRVPDWYGSRAVKHEDNLYLYVKDIDGYMEAFNGMGFKYFSNSPMIMPTGNMNFGQIPMEVVLGKEDEKK